MNYFLIGPMAAGKTTLGAEIAVAMRYKFLDSDDFMTHEVRISPDLRKTESSILNEITILDDVVVATGGGCILEPRNREILSSRGIVIYLKVSVEEQVYRLSLANNDHRGLLPADGVERIQYLEAMAQIRTPLYEQIADITIDTENDLQ